MKTELQKTADGSHTLFVPELNEHFHSTFGAVQESLHVFIKSGLDYFPKEKPALNILEMGFGTGLNALLTWFNRKNHSIHYTSIEASPLEKSISDILNYPQLPGLEDTKGFFLKIHEVPWNQKVILSPDFTIEKRHEKFENAFLPEDFFDLVYFDAFAPDIQPELWTTEIFRKLFAACREGAILVTYSSKGQVKRNLQEAGFDIEKLPGPPGKRHILRGRK